MVRTLRMLLMVVAVTWGLGETNFCFSDSQPDEMLLSQRSFMQSEAYQQYRLNRFEEFSEVYYLIDLVEYSQCSYLHNGREYSSKYAARFLKFKIMKTKDEISNTEEFIEYVVGESSGGHVYYVIDSNGRKHEAKNVFYRELERLREFDRQEIITQAKL